MPIRVLVFAQELDFPRYRDRLAEYEYTSSQVSLEFVDVDKNPVLARQYEVQSYGTVVFDYNGRIERVVSDQEQELTNALIKAVEGEERKVYFLQGHGERIPTDTERDGYSSLTDALRLDNLSVDTLILAQIGEVPSDAEVVVVAGPATDLLPAEVDLLREYLDGGGKMLFFIDPPDEPNTAASNNLIGFIREWGIEVGLDVVVDVSGNESPSEIRVAVFGDSDFAANGALGIQGNRDLVLNAMSWLAEQENLISIRPRQPEDRRITLTADQQFRVVLASLLLIPALIIGAGVLTWWRRR